MAALVAGFPKSQPGRPSLLRHGDVEALFREFGRLMQLTLTKTRYGRFSGANEPLDFAEAPSRLLESWAWSPEVLKRISGRYDEPAKKLPDALLQRLLAARNADAALQDLQQVALAELDMIYHGPRRVGDTTRPWRRLRRDIVGIDLPPYTHPEAGFAALERGGAGSYYSSLWSRVYADDLFSRFQERGLLDPIVGRRFRQEILEPGGSRDERESVRSFLGREPSDAAFLKALNH